MTEHPRDVNVTIIEGAIVLTCTATGFPSPTITWFHNNTLNVIGSYATESANVYTTKSIFTRLSPMTNDSGRYFCSAAIDGYDDVHSDIVMVLVQGEKLLIVFVKILSPFLMLKMHNYRCSRKS